MSSLYSKYKSVLQQRPIIDIIAHDSKVCHTQTTRIQFLLFMFTPEFLWYGFVYMNMSQSRDSFTEGTIWFTMGVIYH